jgi:mannose-6-phosphate isomerase-like protein (cupin superfamily)
MHQKILKPTIIQPVGNLPKIIEEYFGRVNSGDTAVSIAKMKSVAGWEEPGQTPEFDEYTVVLSGTLRVESKNETVDVHAGQAIHTKAGKWVRYSSPNEGAEYIAVCLPAFSPDTVHRDGDAETSSA